jgi:hypothetical protein
MVAGLSATGHPKAEYARTSGERCLTSRKRVNRMTPDNSVPCSASPGTMMVQEGLLFPDAVNLRTDAYSRGWRSVQALDSFSLGRNLAVGGWHLFFVAGHVTAIAFGHGNKSLCLAVKRIAAKVRALNLNCLELTKIVRKRFLGIPYVAISAGSFHIQKGWQLQSTEPGASPRPEL